MTFPNKHKGGIRQLKRSVERFPSRRTLLERPTWLETVAASHTERLADPASNCSCPLLVAAPPPPLFFLCVCLFAKSSSPVAAISPGIASIALQITLQRGGGRNAQRSSFSFFTFSADISCRLLPTIKCDERYLLAEINGTSGRKVEVSVCLYYRWEWRCRQGHMRLRASWRSRAQHDLASILLRTTGLSHIYWNMPTAAANHNKNTSNIEGSSSP